MKKSWPAMLMFLAACSTTDLMRDARPSGPPCPDQAKVVIYRTSAFGGGSHFPVYEVDENSRRLVGFTEWRRHRSSKLEELGLVMPDVDRPRAPEGPPQIPKRRAASKGQSKAVDVWSKVLQEFDDRDKRA